MIFSRRYLILLTVTLKKSFLRPYVIPYFVVQATIFIVDEGYSAKSGNIKPAKFPRYIIWFYVYEPLSVLPAPHFSHDHIDVLL